MKKPTNFNYVNVSSMPKEIADKMMEAYLKSGSASGKNVFAQTLLSKGADAVILGSSLSDPKEVEGLERRMSALEQRMGRLEAEGNAITEEMACQGKELHRVLLLMLTYLFPDQDVSAITSGARDRVPFSGGGDNA